MESPDAAYFRETSLLVAESQKMIADAWAANHRAALAAEETRKRIAESLALIEAAKKLRQIKPAMVGGKPGTGDWVSKSGSAEFRTSQIHHGGTEDTARLPLPLLQRVTSFWQD